MLYFSLAVECYSTQEKPFTSSMLNYRWILNLNVKSAELLKILERPAVSEFGKFGDNSPHVTI